MMFDLDNFKQLNDTLGHDAGDELLRMIGPRLAGSVRADDVVARLGGDEFAILLDARGGPRSGIQGGRGRADSLQRAVPGAGGRLRLTASVGIATYPQDANTPEALLKCMDVAMYEAKRSRRGWEDYASERDQNTRERLEMTGDLASALEGGAIEAHLQPIVDTVTRRSSVPKPWCAGANPTARCERPATSWTLLELAGLSRPLTRRMLDLALGHVSGWQPPPRHHMSL